MEGKTEPLPEQAAQAKGPETQNRWQILGVRQEKDPNTNGSRVARYRPPYSPAAKMEPDLKTSGHREDSKTPPLATVLCPRHPGGSLFSL